jgi:hypothetical protein
LRDVSTYWEGTSAFDFSKFSYFQTIGVYLHLTTDQLPPQIEEVPFFVRLFFLALVILFIIFLPSYCGQQLISESEKLNQSLFNFLQVKKSKKLTNSRRARS